MPIFQPRSILQLVLVGFLVVLLPILGALVYGAGSFSTLAQSGSDDLEQVADTAEIVQKLAKGLTDIERLTRQYLLIKEPSLLTAINAEVTAYGSNLLSLRLLRPEPEIARNTEQSEDLLLELKRALSEKPPVRIIELIQPLNLSLLQLRQALEIDLKRKVAAAKDAAQTIRTRLLILGFTVLPGTLVLVGLFSVLITRPIKMIDKGIKQIGTGSYQQLTRRFFGPRDLQLVAERLRWLGQRVRASEESQERFLRHISHELKTPLATIKEGIELLADGIPGPLTPQQGEVLAILRNGIQHFQVLINNLLDFNLVRSNKALNREEVDLMELVQSIVRLHQLTAQRKSVEFELKGEPLQVSVDRSVLSAAIDNLVSNAVHFSPEGGKVHLRWWCKPEGLTLLIGDEGPGIAPDEREKVFLPFFQGKATRVGPLKGTGIGLSVARECIELHKGQIRILDADRGAWLEMFLPGSALTQRLG